MSDLLSSVFWQSEFYITEDDLDRIATIMREEKRALNIDKMARRIVRGRLRYGPDMSPPVLSEWIGGEKVLSWDEEEEWEIGSRVLVAIREDGNVKPFMGIIENANEDTFFIRLEDMGKKVKYARVKPGSQQAQKRIEAIHEAIAKKGQAAQRKQLSAADEENVEIVLLEHGAYITSKLLTALQGDMRYFQYDGRWFLGDLLVDISSGQIQQLYLRMLTAQETLTLSEIIRILGWEKNDVHVISLHHVLQQYPEQFEALENRWCALKPPPPSWDQAQGTYYVYDPDTYEIILQPGQPLKKQVAERLKDLGWYEDVVKAVK